MGALDHLNALGFFTRLKNGLLEVSPASQLPPEIRQYISMHLTELIQETAYLDALTPQQDQWLGRVACALGCSRTDLLNGGFIDSDDLKEQLGADPHAVARLIRTNPRWQSRSDHTKSGALAPQAKCGGVKEQLALSEPPTQQSTLDAFLLHVLDRCSDCQAHLNHYCTTGLELRARYLHETQAQGGHDE